jgi:hypothetical protein
MTTYSETKNKPPFNWELFLKNARKGRITEEQSINATERAHSWVTCACGNQCKTIPRFGGVPLDNTLATLGSYFFEYVTDRNYDEAMKTLHMIETRSAEVLRSLPLVKR